MKISYSRFTAFLQNPERYRLYYGLGLIPEGVDVPTAMNYGRRRGSCVHAIHEADGKGLRHSVVTEHKYPDDMYQRCLALVAKLPGMEVLLSEAEFECPIGNGKHSITGRLDHVFKRDGQIRIGDIKSTKKRTKKEMREYFATLETSSQSHFYLYVAGLLGFPTDQFTYHVLVDEKDAPEYIPFDLPSIGPVEVERTMRGVYAACEAIEGLTEKVGLENPWPHSNHWPCCGDKFFCGYGSICGRTLPVGCIPTGFVSRHPEESETV